MKQKTYNSSILLSIFKRKGGEGFWTKLINEENKYNYYNELALVAKDENALVCFKEDELNWLLITTDGICAVSFGEKIFMPFTELADVSLAMKEEFKDSIVSKEDFTRLALTNMNGNRYVVKIEKGEPFQGIYQMLHHIASSNKSLSK
ncbi:hypothetical protein DBR32_12615 [Taibaiella sp. KBW10]|uniref:hypothetical protein n=1 Tax=Taibaiella sp. KBW10 TaxID=2153357 RepID=UPI000F5A4E42|nr:hypothetical protein [Taibaiella sp. KBW10]RQO30405.1 hypothetical protein DBR32_12615 [Taibaiella sp. KBW10]